MKLASALTVGGLLFASPAGAATFGVYTGYVDNAHTNGTFAPSPWLGDAGVVSQSSPGITYDAGAIRIDNTDIAPLTVTNMAVTFASQTFSLWSALTIPAGDKGIFTETAQIPVFPGDNFDTSEMLSNATISFDIGSVPYSFTDASVLDNGGVDRGFNGKTNEGLNWVFDGQGGTPTTRSIAEPGGLAVLGLGLIALSFVRRKGALPCLPTSQ